MMLPILFHVGIAVRRCEDLLDMTINNHWKNKDNKHMAKTSMTIEKHNKDNKPGMARTTVQEHAKAHQGLRNLSTHAKVECECALAVERATSWLGAS